MQVSKKRNPLHLTGAKLLAEMLAVNQQIHTLDLVNTGIGEDGLAWIVEAVKVRKTPKR